MSYIPKVMGVETKALCIWQNDYSKSGLGFIPRNPSPRWNRGRYQLPRLSLGWSCSSVSVRICTSEPTLNLTAIPQFIEDLTTNYEQVQETVLAEILSRNAETDYLKRHGMAGAADRETFRSKVPVIKYEDIQPDIQRIAHGDFSPILCAQPISEFFTSSGTSGGKPKLIPTTDEEIARRHSFYNLLMPVMNQYMTGLDKGKALCFLFTIESTKTPGGLPASTILTSYYNSPHFKNRPSDPYNYYTSPDEAILCPDTSQSMYTHLICGLYDRLHVLRVGSVFPQSILSAIRFLRLHYLDICHDISTGTLNSRIVNPVLRARMSFVMRPDSELAGFIHHVCQEDNWEGIIKRIWPNTKYLDVLVTGVMAQYIPILDYYSGGLPKVCTMYGSSECYSGLNLSPLSDPSDVSYTLMPNMAYYEFIPLETPHDSTQDSIVDLANVQVGKEYELVLTNYAGLYRYRSGDVIYVTGFHNSAPQFKLMRRKDVILSIGIEKTNESELQNAVHKASALLRPFNTSIVDYTSYADIKTLPGHYVLYWELLIKDSMNGPDPKVLDQCCLEIEEALNWAYGLYRVSQQSIGPLEIRVVQSGTFEKLMEYALSRGASIGQYKVPRCVKLMPMLELLDSRVVSAHFSPSMPNWSP